jgi:DNA-binding NarL/FixJ family response regulator
MTKVTLIVTRAIKLHQFYKKRLEEFGFNNLIITAADKDGLAMMIEDMKPCLVLVDACFYETSTPYMLGRLLDDFPTLNIAVVNMYNYPEDKAIRFILNGVHSYVNMFEGYDEFAKGLKIVRDGKDYVSPNILERINLLGEKPEPADKITLREDELIQQLCSGRKEKEIADIMAISLRTLHKHREKIYRNLDVDNRIDLFWTALSAGLVKINESFNYSKNSN